MTRQTTVLLSLSPRNSGMWGDSIYRLSHTAQLVEGGSAAHWLVTATQPAQHLVSPHSLVLETPDSECVVSSVLLLVALHVGDENAEGLLVDTHNVQIDSQNALPVRQVAEFWEIESRVGEQLARMLAPHVRMAVTVLDEMNIFSNDVVSRLRALDFEIEVFRQDTDKSAA
jgi:hypothetical protein